ncbi:hypothetical protein HS125_04505 [bacterium]|nr:hypothetical protein [bacterium]
MLLGCRDGYLRRYQAGMAAWDDGLSFDSWVVYGPLTADRAGLRDGLLVELAGTLADEVNRVRWSVVSRRQERR